MATQPSPISLAAQNDPQIQAAMRQISDATEALYRALSALSATTPRLRVILADAVGPGLCEQAVQQGRARI